MSHKITDSARTRTWVRPPLATGALALADGTVLWGRGVGATSVVVGEVCFNTSITGYQEILTDPSYSGQIITFTFPHIGNVGVNEEDVETINPPVRGCILRADISEPSNWRSGQSLNNWLKSMGLVGLVGVDTRKLTRRIRESGAPIGALMHGAPGEKYDIAALVDMARSWPGLEGMDLAREVTCHETHEWHESTWSLGHGYGELANSVRHVVAVDYGAKHNILRSLVSLGCRVTVVPATATADDVLHHAPDGVFLSNGPGDPAATGEYAVPVIREILNAGVPTFGICLGHQILALALGAGTEKMHHGHRGANHPVKNLVTGKVEITSQNHGFTVVEKSLPSGLRVSHRSLFDGSVEGLALDDRPVFSVQYHPEASPGPHDSRYLFEQFVALMDEQN